MTPEEAGAAIALLVAEAAVRSALHDLAATIERTIGEKIDDPRDLEVRVDEENSAIYVDVRTAIYHPFVNVRIVRRPV